MIRDILINVDLYKQNYNSIKLKQLDTTKITFNVLKNGVTTDLSGHSFILNFLKSDSTVVIQNTNFDTTNISDGIVSVTLVDDCVSIAGESKIELQIKKDGNLISNFTIDVIVENALLDYVTSENKNTIVEELNDAIGEGISTKTALENVIATADTTTYATKGDINEVSEQLTENENYLDKYTIENQENFIDVLQRNTPYNGKLSVLPNDIGNALNLSIVYEIGNGKAVSYTAYKQLSIDKFIKLGLARYGTLSGSYYLYTQKDMDTRTGAWNTTTTYYTTEVGATMSATLYCSQIVFHHASDPRGGIWKFIIDGDTLHPITISTWNSTSLDKDEVLFTDTVNKTHTVLATFMGDDPNNPPSGGAGTSRGWCNHIGDQFTFKENSYNKSNASIVDLFVSASNWEWAFMMRKNGTSDPFYFIPYHTTSVTFENTAPTFIVDGVPVTLTKGLSYNDIKEFKIVQSVYGRVPEHPNDNLIRIDIVTTFKGDGKVSFDGKMTVLTAIEVQKGYVDMAPFNPTFVKKIITGVGNSYPTIIADDSLTYLTDENDKCISYLGLNDSAYTNVGMAIVINNPKQTLRRGQTGKPNLTQTTLIQHRSDNNQKLYPQVYLNADLPVGYTHRFSGTYLLGVFDGLYNLF